MGTWLDQHLPEGARILVSPSERAQQTAIALKRKFKTVDDLAPGASVHAILSAAGWPDSREPVVIVGHQPTLGSVAAFLVSGEETSWPVKKGSVWWLSNRDRTGYSAVVVRAVLGPDFA
jgi:phosphohistidine phosphatase